MLDSYAIFDLETTGLDPSAAVITEIGWLLVLGGVALPPTTLLVNCGRAVPQEVALLTGITTALLQNEGYPLATALSAFLRCTAELPLVGHNIVRFDVPFVEVAAATLGYPPPRRDRYVDTAAIYKARALGVQLASFPNHWSFAEHVLNRPVRGLRYTLSACCDALGIPRDDVTAHRVAGDVTLTQRLYQTLTAPPGERGRCEACLGSGRLRGAAPGPVARCPPCHGSGRASADRTTPVRTV